MKNQSGKNMHFCKNGTQGAGAAVGQGVSNEIYSKQKYKNSSNNFDLKISAEMIKNCWIFCVRK